ncbi:D-3-phosphoglycerate dehydrogenase [Verrucomicrobiota bacterium]|nr:D-3-phosphoglycerate dehydrogenase [Verrucomicrobiota bacterium]
MNKPKVLVADPVSERGIAELQEGGLLDVTVKTGLKEDELLKIIGEFDGLVVRSQTKVNARVIEAAKKLKVVGRAGVGVDNVDVEAATKRGVVVMNTPAGNTISTAEHAFSLLMAISRNIAQADASVKAGKWDRKSFEGVELYGKTLAILGMGRIGTEIARRAIAFGMRVFAYDPYLSASRARSLQVELVERLDEIVPLADYITMHMPLTDETKNMLNAERLAKTKKGVRIINCARGGLIDEKALYDALKSRQVAAAALDVYEVEPPPADFPLRSLPNIVLTPHLGASTAEAQENVGIEVAQQIRAMLMSGEVRNAVNMPNVDAKTLAIIGPHIALGARLGTLLRQIAAKRCDTLNINFSGKINEHDTTAITRAILKNFLHIASGGEANEVNAPDFAKQIGLKVTESRESIGGDFAELIELTATGEGGWVSVAGTFFGNQPRVVKMNGRHIEARPDGVLLIYENKDRPGMVGWIGNLMGKHGVNIANMSLGRNEAGGLALAVLNLDSVPGEAVLKEMLAEPDIKSAQVVQL